MVRKNLTLHFPLTYTTCPVCNHEDDDKVHLFFKCQVIRSIWFDLPWNIKWKVINPIGSIVNFTRSILNLVGVLPILPKDVVPFQFFAAIMLERL